PPWIETGLLDLTALGSSTVLGLVIVAVAGFLALQRHFRSAVVVLFTGVSAGVLHTVLKLNFMRERPTIVPHLRETMSTSFPSGHAMDSAIVYLTLGAMV